jgi:hypothetical protein
MVIKLEPGSEPQALRNALEKIQKQSKRPLDLKAFVGILPKKENPLDFQKRLRDGW